MQLPIVPPGKRALALGRTGSGKTTGAAWLLSRSPGNWVVLNVKYDELLTRLGPDTHMDVGTVLAEKRPARVRVIHPATFEQGELDDFVAELGESRAPIGLMVDEMLYLSKGNGQAGPGLIGWLTRGRARHQSFIGATQRPAAITNFAYSEADFFAVYDLKLARDWAKIREFTGRDLADDRRAHRWAWYDVAADRKTEYGPVPAQGLVNRFRL